MAYKCRCIGLTQHIILRIPDEHSALLSALRAGPACVPPVHRDGHPVLGRGQQKQQRDSRRAAVLSAGHPARHADLHVRRRPAGPAGRAPPSPSGRARTMLRSPFSLCFLISLQELRFPIQRLPNEPSLATSVNSRSCGHKTRKESRRGLSRDFGALIPSPASCAPCGWPRSLQLPTPGWGSGPAPAGKILEPWVETLGPHIHIHSHTYAHMFVHTHSATCELQQLFSLGTNDMQSHVDLRIRNVFSLVAPTLLEGRKGMWVNSVLSVLGSSTRLFHLLRAVSKSADAQTMCRHPAARSPRA